MNIFLNYTYLTENVTFFCEIPIYSYCRCRILSIQGKMQKLEWLLTTTSWCVKKKWTRFHFLFCCCCWVSYVLKIKKMIFISPLICLNYFDFRVQKLVFPFIPGTSDLSWKDVQKNVICNCIYYELNPKKINSLQTITFTC